MAMVVAAPTGGLAGASAPLIWIVADHAGEPAQRVALAVIAQVAGRPCELQLDTGLDEAVRWHAPTTSQDNRVTVPVRFAGILADVQTPAEIAHALRECKPDEIVGSLGNAFFDAGSLTLDLKTSQLRYTEGAALSAVPSAQPMRYARWGKHGGHTLVELRKDAVLQGWALLDTGSAAFGIATLSAAQWDAATSHAPLAATPGVREFQVSSWGRTHTCHVTRATASFRAGDWPLGQLPVSWCPDLGFTPPEKLEGVLGLRGFAGTVMTLDYVSGRWLATRESSSDAAHTSTR